VNIHTLPSSWNEQAALRLKLTIANSEGRQLEQYGFALQPNQAPLPDAALLVQNASEKISGYLLGDLLG
jgi:hypothetical protein